MYLESYEVQILRVSLKQKRLFIDYPISVNL